MQKYVAKKYYRFGVLEGNHVEERYGLDGLQKPEMEFSKRTEQRDKYPYESTLYNTENYSFIDKSTYPKRSSSVKIPEPIKNPSTLTKEFYESKDKLKITEQNPKLNLNNELQKSLALNMRGEPHHIIIGHGLNEDSFKNREFNTVHDLSFDSKIKPTVFLNSKFDNTIAGTQKYLAARRSSMSDQCTNIQTNQSFDKNHYPLISTIGDKSILNTSTKPFKSYDEYTKSFDATWKKTGLRKQGHLKEI